MCCDTVITVLMTISDVPGAPDAPLVEDIFADSCTVTWQPPASDGGAPITGYHLERRMVGQTLWIKVNKDPTADLSLKPTLEEGTEYEFRVAAENQAGIGPFSPPSVPITAKNPWDVPGKPGTPEVYNLAGFTLDLKWTAPDSDGGAEITHYFIQYRTSGDTKWKDYNNKEKVWNIVESQTITHNK